MIKYLLTSFLFLVLQYNSIGQYECGTIDTNCTTSYSSSTLRIEIDNLQSNKRSLRTFMISYNIIRDDNGNKGISEAEAMSALEQLNYHYQLANLRFELCQAITYIDNPGATTYTKSETKLLAQNYMIENVINVFFFPRIVTDNHSAGICGFANFPNEQHNKRMIAMNNGCVKNRSTFIHEFGHFFGLQHTHSTSNGKELVQRSNCQKAGDRLCDTPADPKLNSTIVSNCTYIGQSTDNNGDHYAPDTHNYMSYAPSSCRDQMSNEQIALISLVAQNENSYIYNECQYPDINIYSNNYENLEISNFKDIKLDINIRFANIKNTMNTTLIGLLKKDGQDIPLFEKEIEIDQDINLIQESFILINNKDLINADQLHVYIDKPDLISELSETNNAIILDIKLDIPETESFIFPNPVNEELSILSNHKLFGNTSIIIYDIHGRLIKEQNFEKSSKHHLETINTTDLTSGVYFLHLNYKNIEMEVIKFIKI